MTKLTAILGGLILSAGLAAQDSSPAPNILFIMTDDHAAHAVGAYGGRLADVAPTPNIDRLANEGVLLKNAFVVNSICTPSRATLLTGQYPHEHGVRTLRGQIEPARQHLARAISEAGYNTAMIGKWHLGAEPGAFDHYAVLPGQGSYFNPIMRVKGQGEWPDNFVRFAKYDSEHSSDVVTDQSLKWLESRDTSRPFFLMHHFKAPHDNFENAERYDWMYNREMIPEPASLWSQPDHGSAATATAGTSIGKRNERRNMGHHMFVDPELPDSLYKQTAYQRYLKKYLRTVKGVDDNIGRLLSWLEESGQLDNTIVVYTSDQGFMLGEHDYIDKRWMYEESLRVPFIVRYPASIPAGSTSEAIVNNVDFAPTLIELAGGTIPSEMRGRSFKSILTGQSPPADWKQATYYRYWMHMTHHDNPAHYGIRTQDFKLIFFYGLPLDAAGALEAPTQPGWELYDLRNDPHEMVNVYDVADYASVRARLKDELLLLKKEVGDTDEDYPELMAVRERHWN